MDPRADQAGRSPFGVESRAVVARGDRWRLKAGDITLEALAAQAESARLAGWKRITYAGQPPKVYGVSLTVDF